MSQRQHEKRTIADQIGEYSNDFSPSASAFADHFKRQMLTDPLGNLAVEVPGRLRISILIPVFNMGATVARCVHALLCNTYVQQYSQLCEIVVVDYGSTDGTWEIIQHLQKTVGIRIARQARSSGQGSAMNTAAVLATGDILVSCDADMMLHPFAIAELVKRHLISTNIVCVGFRTDVDPAAPNISFPDLYLGLPIKAFFFWEDNRITYHWDGHPYPGWPDNMCLESDHLKLLGHGRRILLPDGDEWSLPRMVYGALFSISHSLYDRIGGFDERLLEWGYGDTTLAAKARANGAYIIPVYSAAGLHLRHPHRSPAQWLHARKNKDIYEQILKSPMLDDILPAKRTQAAIFYVSPEAQLNPPSQDAGMDFLCRVQTQLKTADRSEYLFRLGRFTETVDLLSTPQRTREDCEHPLTIKLVRALRNSGQIERAFEEAEKSIRSKAPTADILVEQAFNFAAAGEFAHGHHKLKEAYNVQPTNALVRYILKRGPQKRLRRAREYMRIGMPRLARKDVEGVFLADPNCCSKKCADALKILEEASSLVHNPPGLVEPFKPENPGSQ